MRHATTESRQAVARARFFLDGAKTCSGDAHVEFEAYIEAAIIFSRAALHRTHTKYRHHPGCPNWWHSLAGNPAVKFFRNERDWILKEAPPKIRQIVFLAGAGSSDPPYQPGRATEHYFFETGVPAIVTVERHLTTLEQLIRDADGRFASVP